MKTYHGSDGLVNDAVRLGGCRKIDIHSKYIVNLANAGTFQEQDPALSKSMLMMPKQICNLLHISLLYLRESSRPALQCIQIFLFIVTQV